MKLVFTESEAECYPATEAVNAVVQLLQDAEAEYTSTLPRYLSASTDLIMSKIKVTWADMGSYLICSF